MTTTTTTTTKTTDNTQVSIRRAELSFQLQKPQRNKQTSYCPLLLTLLLSMFYQFKPFNFDASPYLHVFLVFPSFDVLLGSNLPNLCSIHFTSFIWSIVLWVFDWSNSKDFIGCFFLGVAIFSLPASHQPYLATAYHGGRENILGKSSRGSCAIS